MTANAVYCCWLQGLKWGQRSICMTLFLPFLFPPSLSFLFPSSVLPFRPLSPDSTLCSPSPPLFSPAFTPLEVDPLNPVSGSEEAL